MGKNRKPNPKNANLGRSLIREKNNARRGMGHTKDTWVNIIRDCTFCYLNCFI